MQKISEELKREIERMHKEREARKNLQHNTTINMANMAKDLLEEKTQVEVESIDIHETMYGYCAILTMEDLTIYLYPHNIKNNVVVMQENTRWEFDSIKSSLYLINNLI